MARTNDPHAATVKAWLSRTRAQAGAGTDPTTQRHDYIAVVSRGGGSGGSNIHQMAFRGLTQDSPEVKSAAEKRAAEGAGAEPEMTKLMQDIAAATGGELSGLKFRLKSADGVANKAIRDSRENEKKIRPDDPRSPMEHVDEAIGKMNDVNRYTVLYPPEELVERTERAQKALLDAGWEPYDTKAKNFFRAGGAYEGYNTVYHNPKTGAKFELQFHTPESVKIKEVAHVLYNKWRDLPDTPENAPAKKSIRAQMTSLWENYQRPANWDRLQGVRMGVAA